MFDTENFFDLNSFLDSLTRHPGVYRMYNKEHVILYIGKAKNLYERVNNYFKNGAKEHKTQILAEQVAFIDITVTPSDYDAFLLESTLIKKYKPKYNILFTDDRSYPYLYLSEHVFPRLTGFRGKPLKKGHFFGPYTSLACMKDTLLLLQKLFLVRQCEDSYFNSRSRPCLQYQIKRCNAPCVAKITPEKNKVQVDLLVKFMSGKLTPVLREISQKMNNASECERFEEATKFRDQLKILTKLQQRQILDTLTYKRLDVIGVLKEGEKTCITLLSIQSGKVEDDKHWFISREDVSLMEILEAFLSHFYLAELRVIWPEEVILPKSVFVSQLLLESIMKKASHQIRWISCPIADNAKWQKLALINARQKLHMHLQSKHQFTKRLEVLAKWLNISEIKRIECFDVSHNHGEATVASCVVFDQSGAVKSAYRRYNIKNITRGDDYAAIAQAVTRRVESGIKAQNLPDVIIIDGGKGQLKKAEDVLLRFNQENSIQLISLGKGVERISGKEDIFCGFNNITYNLPEYDLGFLLLRQIRDASHDFAIRGQRKKLIKRQTESIIESIEGVGIKRRQALLHHFGGWQELTRASIDEIVKVKGISSKLANQIWNAVH